MTLLKGWLGLVSIALLAGVWPQSVEAAVREAHFSGGAGTTTGPVDITELHARYDDEGRLAVSVRFAAPLPEAMRMGWAASEWLSRDRCGNSVSVNLFVSGETAWGWWQPGYLTVVYDIESASIADDRRSVKTVIRYEMKDRDFRCVVAGLDGSSESIGPVLFDLPVEELRVRKRVWRGPGARRPGGTVLSIAATEGAKVRIAVRRTGHRGFVRRFIAEDGPPVQQRFEWNCARPGVYRFTVRARDAYGNVLVRRGRWTVGPSHCVRLR